MSADSDVKQLPICRPGLDELLAINHGFEKYAMLQDAIDLKVFDILATHPGGASAVALSEEQGWNTDNTERFLNTLVSLNLVAKVAEHEGTDLYSNNDCGRYLLTDQKGSTHNLFAVSGKVISHQRGQIAEEVKTGAKKAVSHPHHVTVHKKPTEEGQQHIGQIADAANKSEQGHGHGQKGDPRMIVKMFTMMDSNLLPVVEDLVTAFDLSRFKSMVDLGGGSGVVSYQLSRSYPAMKVTLFDVPPVIAMVKEHFQPDDFNSLNVEYIAGDFMEDTLPAADVYLLSKVIHDWKPDQIDLLLGKVSTSINPGGAIMLFEKCLHNDKAGPSAAHISDTIVMSFCAGRQRSFNEYAQLLNKYGFKDVKFATTPNVYKHDVIFGLKV